MAPTNVVNANGVTNSNSFDNLGRLVARMYPDGAVEKFGYSPAGLMAYTNQLGASNFVRLDETGRTVAETNANGEIMQFTYDPASNPLSLTDGKTNETRWNFDKYNRVFQKFDANENLIVESKYDSNDRLTNRWTPAKGTTHYVYDAVGNNTLIDYSACSNAMANVNMTYDAQNRLSTMTDAAGTCSYTYTPFGALATEDGPWDNDTVTYSYSGQLRNGLNLAQPNASDWKLIYTYDAASRLESLTAPEGAYTTSIVGLEVWSKRSLFQTRPTSQTHSTTWRG